MRLLRVIATLDRRHGGPAAGLRALTPQLVELGHETTFLSMDPAGTDPGVPGAEFVGLGPGRGGYAWTPRLKPWLRAHASAYDAVFVHGLWQYHGRAVREALRGGGTPYFVFPHGMLDPWFRRAYPLKHLKKQLYWQLFERHVLRDAAAVFFTCDEERRLAARSFRPYRCRERVVAYGTAAPAGAPDDQRAAWRGVVPDLGGRPFWLFLGRLHPKKGVGLLLDAYAQLAAAGVPTLPALVLAGPSSDPRYVAGLQRRAAALPGPARVVWPGMLDGPAKWGALRAAEAFVLPSHQENFGIAVAEALAVGTPVLLSRAVNIASEIAAAGAGFVDDDTAAGTQRLLERWAATSDAERAALSRAATALFRERYEIARVARSLIAAITPWVPAPLSSPAP